MSGMESKWSSTLELQVEQQPTLLKPSASNSSCCIFKAPGSLVQTNEKAYEPQIVSVGPYHHGKEALKMVEQHKPRFFFALLERTKDCGVGFDHYFDAVASREKEIRDCYSEHLNYESSVLVKMMVLDACFIVEVFRIFGGVIKPHPDDPISGMRWIFTFLIRDLLGIENQIPFFVLQEVFDLSKGDTAEEAAKGSLSELAIKFFYMAAERPPKQLEFVGDSDVKHLLYLFRLSLIGHSKQEQPGDVDVEDLNLIPSAMQLRQSGIKFKPRKCDGSKFYEIQLNGKVLEIPTLTLDDFSRSFLLNCVAFEQCYRYCSRHITSYVTFMRCLVNKELDAELLAKRQILVNYLGSNAEVATFFNDDLGRHCAITIGQSYLAKIFVEVNRHHRSPWRVHWAGIKHKYFGSPWSAISAFAASFLLVLTVLQAFYAIFAYYRPPK